MQFATNLYCHKIFFTAFYGQLTLHTTKLFEFQTSGGQKVILRPQQCEPT